jgi:hypothetical protein
MPLGLLCLLSGHQRVACIRQRSRSIRSSIHMLHIRPSKGRRDVGCAEWQGEQDPETEEHNPRQQEEDESVPPWLLC